MTKEEMKEIRSMMEEVVSPIREKMHSMEGQMHSMEQRITKRLDAVENTLANHTESFGRVFEKLDHLYSRVAKAEMTIEHKLDDNVKALWDKTDILTQQMEDLKLRVSLLEGNRN